MSRAIRQKFVWTCALVFAVATAATSAWASPKFDRELARRASSGNPQQVTRLIVTLQDGRRLPAEFERYADASKLDLINGRVLTVPNGLLPTLAANGSIAWLDYDRPVHLANFRTAVTVGARATEATLGLSGRGIGVAVIDSGIANWHDDLTARASRGRGDNRFGGQRVAAYLDFTGSGTPYDQHGHGTHVAGTLAGNGYDSNGLRAGMAPEATLVSLKVLDQNGTGTVSAVIQALDWVLKNKKAYNLRVVNLSLGAGVHQSYWRDPLTLATKGLVDNGIVVVAAAGNFGRIKDANGNSKKAWGGVTAPCNAPWVLCVGASSTQGTLTRADDTMAPYSSRGPSAIDYLAKPDIVAPGTGTISLAVPGTTLSNSMSAFLVPGIGGHPGLPYLSLSGTSMSAPVVTGTVAQMLQANPNLTPNLIKAILEYTAQIYAGYSPLEEGAGFLNTVGAVRLARFFAVARPGDPYPMQSIWARHINWGNERIGGGILTPFGDAWATNIVWGSRASDVTVTDLPNGGVAVTYGGDNITWGSLCAASACDNIVWGSNLGDNITWGSACADASCDNITWGSDANNIVWGNICGGGDCDNITWGSADNITWGSICGDAQCDNITWGSVAPGDNITWGSAGSDNITWGSENNITWGSVDPGDNITWGSDSTDNITWGSALDNIVWGGACGDAGCDNIVWGGLITWGDIGVEPKPSWGSGGRRGSSNRSLFDRLTDEELFHVVGPIWFLPGFGMPRN